MLNASVSNVLVYFTFSGDAAYGTDYTAVTSVLINAGDTTGTVTVTGSDDSDVESIESITVTIDAASNAVIASPSNITTYLISRDPQITNGDGPTNVTHNAATFRGNLTYGYTGTVFVFWGTTDGDTNQASWLSTNEFGNLSRLWYAVEESHVCVCPQ